MFFFFIELAFLGVYPVTAQYTKNDNLIKWCVLTFRKVSGSQLKIQYSHFNLELCLLVHFSGLWHQPNTQKPVLTKLTSSIG